MKCRKCGQRAVINMRHHKLALCREHYLEWIPEQTERFIHKYDMFTRDDRLRIGPYRFRRFTRLYCFHVGSI